MPKIERKEHDINPGKEEDIEIKSGRFRLYFQNRYTLISLTNDILTGIFYIIGSLATLTDIPDIYGTYLYLVGGVFLTARPILKIFHNVFIYDDEKLAKQEQEEQEKQKIQEEQSDTKEGNKDSDEEDNEYNEEYYGKDNDEEYEKKEEEQEEKSK